MIKRIAQIAFALLFVIRFLPGNFIEFTTINPLNIVYHVLLFASCMILIRSSTEQRKNLWIWMAVYVVVFAGIFIYYFKK